MATISQVSDFYADPVQKSQMSHFAASLPLGLVTDDDIMLMSKAVKHIAGTLSILLTGGSPKVGANKHGHGTVRVLW